MSKVIYDALSITSKIHSPGNFIEMLGLSDTGITWQNMKGAHGYRDRLYWECISIHYNGTEDMGTWMELTGQGCRAFETYGSGNYEFLFDEVRANPGEMNLTRLDVAFDDDEGILDIDLLAEDTKRLDFVSRFSDYQVIWGSKGITINHGSMKSEIFLRIYDKAKERGFDDGRHWIRVELQLRRQRALAFVDSLGTVGDRFAGVLGNYLRYVDPDDTDGNRWRWPMKPYWADLLWFAQRIRLYEKPGAEYNMANLENFVFKQAGNAVDAYIQIMGEQNFLKALKRRGTMQNPKYAALIRKYGGRRDEKQPKECAAE